MSVRRVLSPVFRSLCLAMLAACGPGSSGPELGAATHDAGLEPGPTSQAGAGTGPGASWEQQVVTDGSWLVEGAMPAVPVRRECLSSPWPALGAAQWIWRAPCSSEDTETRLFLKTFRLPAQPDHGKLEMMVDDYAYVSINDRSLPNDCTLRLGARTYEPAAVCGFARLFASDVTALLHAGENTIRVILHNATNDTTGEWSNPAGLIMRLTIRGGPAMAP
jgi:hypothetical protein